MELKRQQYEPARNQQAYFNRTIVELKREYSFARLGDFDILIEP